MDVDSLTAMVSEKTGLDEGKAKMAVVAVLTQVKEKLPAPAQVYVDQMLGEEAAESVTDAIKGGLGGLLGG